MYFSSSINSSLPCSWHIRGGPFVHASNKCKDKFYFYKKKHLEPVVVVLVYCLSFTQLRFYHSKATYSIWQSSLIIRGINAIQLLNLTANSSFLKGMTKIMTAKKQCGCLCLCYNVCKIRLLGTATNVTLLNGLIVIYVGDGPESCEKTCLVLQSVPSRIKLYNIERLTVAIAKTNRWSAQSFMRYRHSGTTNST